MNKGKRYGVSLLGLLLLIGGGSAQAAPNAQSANQNNNQLHPLLSSSNKSRLRPITIKASCERPNDHDAADLCEQRRMAQAAEDSVWWSRVQAWLGGLGFAGILVTLVFSGLGTRAAARQVRLSRDALIHTDRRSFIHFKPCGTQSRMLTPTKSAAGGCRYDGRIAAIPPHATFVCGQTCPSELILCLVISISLMRAREIFRHSSPLRPLSIPRNLNSRSMIWNWLSPANGTSTHGVGLNTTTFSIERADTAQNFVTRSM